MAHSMIKECILKPVQQPGMGVGERTNRNTEGDIEADRQKTYTWIKVKRVCNIVLFVMKILNPIKMFFRTLHQQVVFSIYQQAEKAISHTPHI